MRNNVIDEILNQALESIKFYNLYLLIEDEWKNMIDDHKDIYKNKDEFIEVRLRMFIHSDLVRQGLSK